MHCVGCYGLELMEFWVFLRGGMLFLDILPKDDGYARIGHANIRGFIEGPENPRLQAVSSSC